ncbi:hypothetical protein DXG03_003286 [Asterophora parasitica]|uniref:PH domain-containing protein n=1 Tax=Asterophora parasitica TaxID=117018 RepID=A0A9P7GBJ7_9AGAR|nr:hypothetical protein DXG03_003286 [Asterophora parasitica]
MAAQCQNQPWLLGKDTFLLDIPTSKPDVQSQDDLLHLHHILVRDPPRDQLPAEQVLCDNSAYLVFPKPFNSSVTDVYLTHPGHPHASPHTDPHLESKVPQRRPVRMAKKRRSLQSLFIPSFLTAPLSPTDFHTSTSNTGRFRSHSTASLSTKFPNASDFFHPSSFDVDVPRTSARDSPPPDFLLDDDPFANLSPAPVIQGPNASSTPTPAPPTPRSPLTPNAPEAKTNFLSSPPAINPLITSGVSRTLSGRARPAYQKPAFAPRPSLPSLNTLARMNIVVTKKVSKHLSLQFTTCPLNILLPHFKVRKGRVGAGLPFEPWDQLDNERTSGESSSSQESSVLSSPVLGPSASPSGDFTADLELDFMDHSEDEPEPDESATSHFGGSVTYAPVLHTSPIQDNLSYSADSEASMSMDDDALLLLSPFSRTLSELSSLTRSASSSTSSSIGSPGDYQWPSPSSSNADHNTSMSSAEDSDTLHSPPDDYFAYPISASPSSPRFDSHNILNSYWSADDLYDSLSYSDDVDTHGANFDNFIDESGMFYEPGTSAGTIRPFKVQQRRRASPRSTSRSPSPHTPAPVSEEALMDASQEEAFDGAGRENSRNHGDLGRGWEQGGAGAGGSSGTSGWAHGNSAGGNGRSSRANRLGRGGGGGDDEDGDDNRRRRVNHSSFSTPSDSETSTDDDGDSTDDHGQPAGARNGAAGSSSVSSDDDVPLAQRIPTALKAQSTIRREVREERDQRRAARAAARAAESVPTPRGQPSLRPPGAGDPNQAVQISSSQEAALHAAQSVRRPRTRTVPAAEMQPFSPDDLTRKLQNMEIFGPSTSPPPPPQPQLRPRSNTTVRREPTSASRPGSAGRGLRDPGAPFHPFASPSQSPPPPRPTRSFHRPDGRKVNEYYDVALPADAAQKLARSLTRKDDASTFLPRASQDEKSPLGRKSGEEPRKVMKVSSDTRSGRTSAEVERPPRPSLSQRPPVPPLPPVDALPTSPQSTRGPVIQQRIFIGDMQRFNMVEIGPSTNAGDVIEMVEAQGSLKGWVGSGGWMVWEIAQDFGMERPIRSFELLADVQASWNKDKTVNTFVIKLTPLATPLSRSAMPSASPMYAGYVEWESKRGKWNKRWLQLREHSLWLSKRDNGRDEVFLCSLSNFDAYFITRLHKAPQPFSFAIKSTDNLSFFENTADYLHIFSCGAKEGNAWMENILLARSYVLHQERHILFNPKAANGNAAGGPGALSRSGTRKQSSARPVQPLLSVAPPLTMAQQMHSIDVFEPGSLLRKHA